jgi:hypothetical protein
MTMINLASTHRFVVLGLSLSLSLSLALLAAGCAAPSTTRAPRQSDYAREARWAAEFEPGLVVGDAVRLPQANGHRFVAVWAARADPAQRKRAVVLVHGIGVHPDHGLTGKLRADLFDAGYATLSIQAPIVDMAQVSDAGAYAGLMDEAAERIDVAVAHARAQGAQQVFLVGHTTGAWMVNHFLGAKPDRGLTAWASLGQTGRFTSFGANKPATLDLYPDGGSHWPRTAAPQRLDLIKGVNPQSKQQLIAGTDLGFEGGKPGVRDAIVAFFAMF